MGAFGQTQTESARVLCLTGLVALILSLIGDEFLRLIVIIASRLLALE